MFSPVLLLDPDLNGFGVCPRGPRCLRAAIPPKFQFGFCAPADDRHFRYTPPLAAGSLKAQTIPIDRVVLIRWGKERPYTSKWMDRANIGLQNPWWLFSSEGAGFIVSDYDSPERFQQSAPDRLSRGLFSIRSAYSELIFTAQTFPSKARLLAIGGLGMAT